MIGVLSNNCSFWRRRDDIFRPDNKWDSIKSVLLRKVIEKERKGVDKLVSVKVEKSEVPVTEMPKVTMQRSLPSIVCGLRASSDNSSAMSNIRRRLNARKLLPPTQTSVPLEKPDIAMQDRQEGLNVSITRIKKEQEDTDLVS